MNTDFDAVLLVHALIIQYVYQVQHQDQPQASSVSVLSMLIKRGAFARIERPAVIHNSQNDVFAFDNKFNVDEMRVVVYVSVTHYIDNQFVDRQIHGVSRSVWHAVGCQELGQSGIQTFEFRELVFDRQFELAFAQGDSGCGLL